MQNFELILASSSTYRQALLKKLGLAFSCQSPDIDESPRDHEPPADYVLRLSREKALKIWQQNHQAWVIGSDQGAFLGSTQLRKPGNAEKAFAQLQASSGNEMVFYTGLALVNPQGEIQEFLDTTRVKFKTLSARQIQRYLELDQPWDTAGSFKSESLGISLFERLETQDPNALVGLPLIGLCQLFAEQGIVLPL